MAKIHFWYDFASTYSYPTAMRIEALSKAQGVQVAWRPFLLGPIFADQNWTSSPFNIFPAKGRYMWRDLERVCGRYGLAFQRPDPFPQNSLLAARVALALSEERRPAFTRAVFHAEFAEGKAIGDPDCICSILTAIGENAAEVMTTIKTEPHRGQLRLATETARALGVFGAPSFTTPSGELFWGDDRLEQALDWTVDQG